MEKYSKYGAAFHLGLRFNKAKKVNGEFELMSGFITGQNKNYSYQEDASATPNTFIFTNYFNLNYHLNYSFYNKNGLRIFISQGIGLLRFTAYDENYNKLNDQLNTRELGEEYSNITVAFPLQFGAMYSLPQGYGIMIRTGWMNSSTDYLDNISNWGNRKRKDNIMTFRFSFIAPLSFN